MRLLSGRRDRDITQLREQLHQEQATVQLLTESVADLERQLHDPGWQRLTIQADQEFSLDGRLQLAAICRLYALKNPLIKRGLALRAAYVWGQGVEITARANGRRGDGEQDVQAVVATFLGDTANQRAVTGPAARERLERELGTGGNVYIALVTRPTTGAVQARTIPCDEIVDIFCNPNDAAEPWYYHRRWTQRVVDPATGAIRTELREQLYPCIDYRPARQPGQYAGRSVAWDSPVLHVDVNRPEGWLFGVPDAYAAIDWAKAYKEFLEDWARLMRSLSRYAWRATAPGSRTTAIKTRLGQAPDRSAATGEPASAGATAVLTPDVALEAINKSGATIDAESGRPLAMMVAAALDVPVTMLLGDPGQTGARATAETLDRPTELAMAQRRGLWGAAYQRMLLYVITEAVRAPQGPLAGSITIDAFGRERVEVTNTDTTVDIDWPELDDTDPATLVGAITRAASTGTIPPETVLRLLLTALGVRQVDEIVEQLLGDDGQFRWPSTPPMGTVDGGADPGSMTPDDEPGEPVE